MKYLDRWALSTRLAASNKKPKIPSYKFRGQDTKIPSLPETGSVAAAKESKVYTGTAMIGIATLHKSNAVPVFSKQEAEDISSMRR